MLILDREVEDTATWQGTGDNVHSQREAWDKSLGTKVCSTEGRSELLFPGTDWLVSPNYFPFPLKEPITLPHLLRAGWVTCPRSGGAGLYTLSRMTLRSSSSKDLEGTGVRSHSQKEPVSESLLEMVPEREPMPDHQAGDKQVYIAFGHCDCHCFSRGLAHSGFTQCLNLKTSSLFIFASILRNWRFIYMWAALTYIIFLLIHSI